MSWRSGAMLFAEMWPLIQARIPDQEERIRFTADLLRLFRDRDIDTYDVEDIHPDVVQALLAIGAKVYDPDAAERRLNPFEEEHPDELNEPHR